MMTRRFVNRHIVIVHDVSEIPDEATQYPHDQRNFVSRTAAVDYIIKVDGPDGGFQRSILPNRMMYLVNRLTDYTRRLQHVTMRKATRQGWRYYTPSATSKAGHPKDGEPSIRELRSQGWQWVEPLDTETTRQQRRRWQIWILKKSH